MPASYQLITTTPALTALCETASQHPLLALDTEFIRRDTYYPKLALIQITWPGNSTPYLLDPLAIEDLSPFLMLITAQHITKILHAGSEDLEIFYQLTQEHITPIFDTQIAHTCTGGRAQTGYAKLVKAELGIELKDDQTCSNWLSRPLSEQQCRYASADVAHLIALHETLNYRLQQLKRTTWQQEELDHVQTRMTEALTAEHTYMKIRHHWQLQAPQLVALKTLCIWREQTAQKENKPRKHILKDDAILALAKLSSEHLIFKQSVFKQQLANTKLFSPRQIKHYHEEWQSLLYNAQNTGQTLASKTPLPTKTPIAKAHQAYLKPIKTLIQERAKTLNIEPEFLLGKRLLNDLIRVTITHPNTPKSKWPAQLLGWRYQEITLLIHHWLQHNAV